MTELLKIDGSQGEGGGQVLRTSLALATATGRPFRIDRIRAGRSRPGLLRQHLTAVRAAAQVAGASVRGDELASSSITFEPQEVRGGEFEFAVGTAGSATLVLQAILPPLLRARTASRVVLEGGTHNPFAPPFDFIDRTLLPLISRMGGTVTARLERHGFYPAGGGRFIVDIEPARRFERLVLEVRGPVQISALALVSGVPLNVATRELRVVHERLGVSRDALESRVVETSPGPGNALLIALVSDHVTEIVTGFGERHVGAGTVAATACREAAAYLDANVPVGRYLADQLLVPMALAEGGTVRTLKLSRHTTTNIGVIRQFMNVDITSADDDDDTCTIDVAPQVRP